MPHEQFLHSIGTTIFYSCLTQLADLLMVVSDYSLWSDIVTDLILLARKNTQRPFLRLFMRRFIVGPQRVLGWDFALTLRHWALTSPGSASPHHLILLCHIN